MPALFITGVGTDVGKTYITAGLIRALTAAGRPVDALKPVVSGFDPAAPQGSDPSELLTALGRPLTPRTLDAISPWQYAAPLSPPLAARREGRILSADDVIALCRDRTAAAGETLLLVEGAGGVMSPLSDETTMLDLAVALETPVLLVAGSYLGAISHTLTAILALRAVGAAPLAVVMSESLDAPPMDETLVSLACFLPDVPLFGVARGGAVPADLLPLLPA